MRHLSIVPRYRSVSAWSQHVPIAHWLVESLRPRTVVELGTYRGVSFFAFCEAAEHYSPETFIHAVDTWQGDEHLGFYGEEVFEKVSEYWGRHHKTHSALIRSTFEEAAGHFGEKSINLLHIDGLHTYEAVRHDYETWLPLVAEDGVILFHDINVRTRGFGVWKLWEELKAEHPDEYLESLNGSGLGLLFLGGTNKPDQEEWQRVMPLMTAKGLILESLGQEVAKVEAARREIGALKAQLARITESSFLKLLVKIQSLFR